MANTKVSTNEVPGRSTAEISRHHNFRLGPIEQIEIDLLKGYGRKLRKRSDKGRDALLASVRSFGIVLPVLIDAQNGIIGGEGIVEAARAAGYTQVPVVRIEHLDEGAARLLRITLNKVGEDPEWDQHELAAEFSELLEMDLELDCNVTGFDTVAIDHLLFPSAAAENDDDELPCPVATFGMAVSRTGDIWLMGAHRVGCGSSLEDAALKPLMLDELARMVLTDHPFNVKIGGHVSGLGKHQHREFAFASGEMSEAQFVAFLRQSMVALSARCIDGGLLYMYMDWRHMWEMTTAIREAELSLINMAVWVKLAGGMGSFLRSQHELCFIAKKGSAPFLNNVQLGRFGRNRTNCWMYPGMNSFGAGRDDLLAMHPTCKNVSMLSDAIRDTSDRGDIVLDGFLGSGSTLIAAERTGRRCFGMELDPLYVDTIVQRWEKATGKSATLESTGETFAEATDRRLREAKVAEPEIAPPPRRRAV